MTERIVFGSGRLAVLAAWIGAGIAAGCAGGASNSVPQAALDANGLPPAVNRAFDDAGSGNFAGCVERMNRELAGGNLSGRFLAYHYATRASCHDWAGRPWDSYADYARAIAADDSTPEIRDWRARALMRDRQYSAAVADLSRAIELDPKAQRYYLRRAYALYGAGGQSRLLLALDDADIAVRLNPNDYLGHLVRGVLREAAGRRRESAESFPTALALKPNDNDAAAGLRRVTSTASAPATAPRPPLSQPPDFREAPGPGRNTPLTRL